MNKRRSMTLFDLFMVRRVNFSRPEMHGIGTFKQLLLILKSYQGVNVFQPVPLPLTCLSRSPLQDPCSLKSRANCLLLLSSRMTSVTAGDTWSMASNRAEMSLILPGRVDSSLKMEAELSHDKISDSRILSIPSATCNSVHCTGIS